VESLSGQLVRETLDELAADFEIAAVRIGMLGSGEVAVAVADFLEERSPKNVVLDPIMSSSSGAELLDHAGVATLRDRLLRLATVMTPNLEEAALLSGLLVTNPTEMERAAQRLHTLGAANVVITGGHLNEPLDLLSMNAPGGSNIERFPRQHVRSSATHGTGCAFATALACNLALGLTLSDAVRLSGEYVRDAIAAAQKLGHGKGPMNHLFARG